MGGSIRYDFPVPANEDEVESAFNVERIGGQLATDTVEEYFGEDF